MSNDTPQTSKANHDHDGSAPQHPQGQSKEEQHDWIDDLLEDSTNAWCEECEHPRCVGRRESFRRTIEAEISAARTEGAIAELESLPVGMFDSTPYRDKRLKELKEGNKE